MKSTLRNVLAVSTAVLGAVAVIMLTEMFGMVLVPPVPDQYVLSGQHASVGSLMIVELGYVLGSVAAGWIAARLGVGSPMGLAAIAGAVLTLGGAINFVMLPHPVWFVVLSLLTFVPMALVGGRMGSTWGSAHGSP